MIDLAAFRQRHVTGWGDRMTVGVLVAELRALVDELETLRERYRVQTAQLDSARVQQDYWERFARASYVENGRLQAELVDLREARDGPKDE